MEGVDAAPRHALGVARVLSEDPPTGDEAAAEKWARHDVICRGHILATLSDRLLPDSAHHATARALWEAVARTYDVETPSVWLDKFREFRFDEGGHFLEQLVHAEALDATAELSDAAMALELRWKLPELVRTDVVLRPGADKRDMSLVWEIARRNVPGIGPERLWRTSEETTEDEVENQPQGGEMVCWTCGKPGHVARNCSVAGHNDARKCRRGA
jgi:hypothetical protein